MEIQARFTIGGILNALSSNKASEFQHGFRHRFHFWSFSLTTHIHWYLIALSKLLNEFPEVDPAMAAQLLTYCTESEARNMLSRMGEETSPCIHLIY